MRLQDVLTALQAHYVQPAVMDMFKNHLITLALLVLAIAWSAHLQACALEFILTCLTI
jgi:hypothetical protein